MADTPNTLELATTRRYGNSEASYDVDERAVVMRTPTGRLVLALYEINSAGGRHFDGLHDCEGYFIGGEISDCKPANPADADVQALAAAWVADGWEVAA